MNKELFKEALLARSDADIIRVRKPLTLPLVVAAVGACLLIGNRFVELTSRTADLKSGLLLIGCVVLFVGAGMVAKRLFDGASEPALRDGTRLAYRETYYPKSAAPQVADALRCGDREALRRLEPGTVPAVIVASFASPDGRFEALWASEYVELEERPLGELCIIRQP